MPKTENPSRWKKGQSGNPNDRPKGISNTQTLRERLQDSLEPILAQVEQAALAGDMQAIRLLLDKVLPPRKAEESPVCLDLPNDASLTAKADAMIQAVASGQIAPSQANQLITALGSMARIIEVRELEARILALEEGKK